MTDDGLSVPLAPPARKVVLTPDLLGQGFVEASAAAVLRLWRDGYLRPVTDRALLVRYLKVLRALGLGDDLLRRWGWWLTASARVEYLPEASPETASTEDLCNELARRAGAAHIVHSGCVTGSGPLWVAAADFLRGIRS